VFPGFIFKTSDFTAAFSLFKVEIADSNFRKCRVIVGSDVVSSTGSSSSASATFCVSAPGKTHQPTSARILQIFAIVGRPAGSSAYAVVMTSFSARAMSPMHVS
jgi:hypothetical protein